jgi:carnosine N-methyltransferase
MAARDIKEDGEEEQVHFQNVIAAFQQYAPYSVGALTLTIAALLLNT